MPVARSCKHIRDENNALKGRLLRKEEEIATLRTTISRLNAQNSDLNAMVKRLESGVLRDRP